MEAEKQPQSSVCTLFVFICQTVMRNNTAIYTSWESDH